MDFNDIMLHFFRDDMGGILISDAQGSILYSDEKATNFIKKTRNWAIACPPAREGQHGETWDLQSASRGGSFMVTTSTFDLEGQLVQIHHITDNSVYMELFRDMNDYCRVLTDEKEHDDLTKLYNKGKFMKLQQSLFRNQDSITVFNMDVNNLKHMNDNLGHESGDRLILKAAESLHRIEARNVMPFRVGGDEFIVVALHLTKEEAEMLFQRWQQGLAELNENGDGVLCEIACGMVYAEKGYDLEDVLARADHLMYVDKSTKKANR